MKNFTILAVLLLALPFPVYAQSVLKGTLIDADTHQPVPGVSVACGRLRTLSDKNGHFSLTPYGKGDSVRFSASGYQAVHTTVPGADTVISLNPSFARLDEVIVSGSREAQRRTEVPVAISVLSSATLNETKATRLDMVLNKVPGVFMVDLGNEQHSMAIRQPMGYQSLFLYLEDGIPIRTTGDFNHNALIEINQAALERIEVIKGPASSLYGSEAVGGAVNFITQAPTPFLSGKAQAEYGSRGYRRTDFTLSDTRKKLGFFLGGYYARQQQPAGEHNDFRKGAMTLRADYRLAGRTSLTTVADYIRYKTDQKGGLDSAGFYSKDYTSFYRFTYRSVDAFRLRSTLSTEWNDRNKTSFTLFYRNTTIGQNPFYRISNVAGNPLKAKGQVNEDAFKSFGSVVQHTRTFAALDARWISGISVDFSPATYMARFTDVDRNEGGVYTGFTLRDSALTDYAVNLLNTAAYLQFGCRPANGLRLVAAARYDRLDYRFDNHLPPGAFSGAPDAADHFDHFTPKLGLTYDFGKGRGAYLNYSLGFAPPNITDLYTGVKVPVLQPSSYTNYEAGGWVSFALGKGSAEATVFRMDGTDEIVSVRLDDGTYQNRNAGKTAHRGVEFGVKYAPAEAVHLRLGGAYADHEYIDYRQQGKDFSGNKMAQAPPLVVNGEATFRPRFAKGLRLSVECQGVSAYYTDAANTGRYAGFAVCNVRAGYSRKGMEVWVNCLNAADKVYATVVERSNFGTTYRPGQLRTLQAGIAYKFRSKINNVHTGIKP